MATETFTPGDLLVGDYPVATRPITVVSGEGVLVRGTVLGKVTASGKYRQSLAASNDGSETPKAILAVDVDATSADVDTVEYASGGFNGAKLTLGTGITLAAVKAAFEAADAPRFIHDLA